MRSTLTSYLILGRYIMILLPLGQVQAQSPFGDERNLFRDLPSVFAASKFEQDPRDAPASVTILSAADIKRFGYQTVADVLRAVRGFSTYYDRWYNYVGTRNYNRLDEDNSRVLLLVDGHRLNDNIFDRALLGTEGVIDIDLIERIEIVRGPGSSLYGSNALFAVINLITKSGRDVRGAEVSAAAGNFATREAKLRIGNRLDNGLEYLFAASAGNTQGDQQLGLRFAEGATINNRIAHNSDDDRWERGFLSMRYHDWQFQAGTVRRTKQVPTAPYDIARFNDQRNQGQDQRVYVNTQYEYRPNIDSVLKARFAWDEYRYRLSLVLDRPYLIIRQPHGFVTTQGRWFTSELSYFTERWQNHRLSLGVEYRRNVNLNQAARLIELNPRPLIPFLEFTLLNNRRHNSVWGVYLQDDIRLSDRWRTSLGIRHDHYETFGGTTNPRLGLIYQPSAVTTAKLLYGRAFRAPNAFELYFTLGERVFSNNPDLGPERIESVEALVEHHLSDSWRVSASVYRERVKDLVRRFLPPGGPELISLNSGQVDIRGTELQFDGILPMAIEFRAAYSGRFGKIESGSPRNTAKLHLSKSFFEKKFAAGLELLYQSRRRTSVRASTAFNNDERIESEIRPEVLTNLTLSTERLLPQVNLSLVVQNVFNRRLYDAGRVELNIDQIPQLDRRFWLKAEARF